MLDVEKPDLFSELILRVAEQTRYLAPWTALPLATASTRVSDLLHHLTNQPLHSVYFPFVRFSVLQAVRTSIAWAAMTRRRTAPVGRLADFFGFLVLSWGGGTAVSLLLGTAPAWLVSPVPWMIYVAVYCLTTPTGMASILASAPALPLGLALALVDAISRGVTVASMPALSEASSTTAGSWLAPALLGAICTCGGGWIVQSLGLAGESWRVGRPVALSGGLLDTLDVWGAVIAGMVYSILEGRYPALKSFKPLFTEVLPDDLQINTGVARGVTVLLLAGLFALRALATALRPATKVAEQRLQAKAASLPAKAAALEKPKKTDQVSGSSAQAETPRRSTRPLSRATTPGDVDTPTGTPSKARKRRSKKKAATPSA